MAKRRFYYRRFARRLPRKKELQCKIQQIMKGQSPSRIGKSLFLLPFFLLLIPIVFRLPRQDTLDKKMQSIAEPNTIDCGRTPAWRTGVAVPDSFMERVVAARESGKPFQLRLNAPNGYMAFGLVGSSDGKLTTINYTWRRRFGLTDWELIEVYRGDCVLQTKNGREEVYMANAKRIELSPDASYHL